MSTNLPGLWSIGSGKGGVGKTLLAASIGAVLSRLEKTVILVDAALGSASLHTCLGIKSPRSILPLLRSSRAKDSEFLIPTSHPGVHLLTCAADVLGAADPTAGEKDLLAGLIAGLEADYVIVDTGSGTSHCTLDFFNLSDNGIVVVTSDPASIQGAYTFIKHAIYRRITQKFGSNPAVEAAIRKIRSSVGKAKHNTMMDFYDLLCTSDPCAAEEVAALVDRYHPHLVVNMASSDADQRVAEILQSTCKKYLNVDTIFCGLLHLEPAVHKATQKMGLIDFDDASIPLAQQVRRTVQNLVNQCGASGEEEGEGRDSNALMTPIMGLNDNLEFMGSVFHIQTEDLGFTGRFITTQVFCNGQVVLSTKSGYPETISGPDDRAKISALMRKQHFDILRELECKKSRVLQTALPQ